MTSCPWVKFVYCRVNGIKKRVGPRVTVEHFVQYNGEILDVIGYSIRGRGQEIFPMRITLNLSKLNKDETIHQIVTEMFAEVKPALSLGISS